jgi:hypothetical protein
MGKNQESLGNRAMAVVVNVTGFHLWHYDHCTYVVATTSIPDTTASVVSGNNSSVF